MNRQQLLRKLDKAWTEFKESFAGLSDAQLTEPGVMGDWSVKDILAHAGQLHLKWCLLTAIDAFAS